MPDIVYGIRGEDIHSTDIKLDWNIVNILRKL
jgi:hypothetical protein